MVRDERERDGVHRSVAYRQRCRIALQGAGVMERARITEELRPLDVEADVRHVTVQQWLETARAAADVEHDGAGREPQPRHEPSMHDGCARRSLDPVIDHRLRGDPLEPRLEGAHGDERQISGNPAGGRAENTRT